MVSGHSDRDKLVFLTLVLSDTHKGVYNKTQKAVHCGTRSPGCQPEETSGNGRTARRGNEGIQRAAGIKSWDRNARNACADLRGGIVWSMGRSHAKLGMLKGGKDGRRSGKTATYFFLGTGHELRGGGGGYVLQNEEIAGSNLLRTPPPPLSQDWVKLLKGGNFLCPLPSPRLSVGKTSSYRYHMKTTLKLVITPPPLPTPSAWLKPVPPPPPPPTHTHTSRMVKTSIAPSPPVL